MIEMMSIGELLVDFVPDGEAYLPKPGGAPANVASVVAKLGHKAAFCGKVGDDGFGRLCRVTLDDAGVDTTCLFTDPDHPTTLVLVTLDETGDRSFAFYRTETADVSLNVADIDAIAYPGVFHFGSVSLTADPSRSAVIEAVKRARAAGSLVTYDPNLRLGLWPSAEAAREGILATLDLCDVLKLADEEVLFLTGADTLEEGIAQLQARFDIPLFTITCGGEGAMASLRGGELVRVAAPKVQVVDTTGAGDAFFGAMICQLLEAGGLDGVTQEKLPEMLRFACTCGSLCCTGRGAIAAIPTREAIEEALA